MQDPLISQTAEMLPLQGSDTEVLLIVNIPAVKIDGLDFEMERLTPSSALMHTQASGNERINTIATLTWKHARR